MRLRAVAETPLEWALDRLGLLPRPLADTIVAMLLSRTVLTGARLGVFAALADGPRTAQEVAARCGTDPRATGKLLFALAGARYLRQEDGRYALTPMARRWMLPTARHSVHDAILHRQLDTALMEHAESFLRTGIPTDFHTKLTPEEWTVYQRGQRAHALWSAPEVARRTPVPRGAGTLLDIGGSHGHYAAALLRRHAALTATVLDLPEAVAEAQAIAAQEHLGDRLRYRAGDALTSELGEAAWDVVFLGNLVHHFDDATNRALFARIARALKPGGTVTVLEVMRSATAEKAGQIGALSDFFFAVTSAGGTYAYDEIASWQQAAGLTPLRPIRLRFAPGYGMQAARKR
ncbi:MAG TPA: class I SAM-dependent methyltransferase [Candidatus Polarisedimenticolaceae bacterium]|nr:class I SAM-dependent methyltransferase [Candidatus Polarisedimenticolaceae bacterium]